MKLRRHIGYMNIV